MKRLLTGVAGLVLVCGLITAMPALAEVLTGTKDADTLTGTQRADQIFGRGGDDVLRGRSGSDVLVGNTGDDTIKGGIAFDDIRAGKGDDRIMARDDDPDQIKCGPGVDTIVVDRVEDGIFNCENKKEP